MSRKSHEQFVKELAEANPTVEPLGRYARSCDKIACRCRVCGYEWSPVANSLLLGHSCPRCAHKGLGANRRYTNEEYVNRLAAAHPSIETIGTYRNSKSRIDVRCRICGYEWSPVAASLLIQRYGCPECAKTHSARNHVKTHSDFLEELTKINPHVEILDQYKRSKAKLHCRCRICGNVWMSSPSNLLNGTGCPRCAKTGTSFMQEFITVFLELALGEEKVKSRDMTAIGMELDILVPELALAIEVGSWHWHADRLERDIEKERTCERQGIRLLTIYDCCPESLEHVELPSECLTFPFSLGEENDHAALRGICLRLVPKTLADRNDIDWERIEQLASERALPRTSEQFVEQIQGMNPTIEITGEYQGAHNRIACRCLSCGHSWKPLAQQLLRGQGCPVCSHRKAAAVGTDAVRKTPELYRRELEAVNPNIELLSDYRGSLQKVQVRCRKCGNEWNARAESILRGYGCPVCADASKRKTTEQFIKELGLVNPSIEVVGDYRKSSIPIACLCKKCGHRWSSRPSKLLSGNGCPRCSGRMRHPVLCVETQVTYGSCAEAARAVGLSSGDPISNACKGRTRTAAGYHWKFQDDG